MVLKKIFGRGDSEKREEEEYIDFNKIVDQPKMEGKVIIKMEKILEYRDAERIQKEVREGNIVIADTEQLKNKDIGELKRAIERIRKTVVAIEGDIVMGPRSILVVCPNYAAVARVKE